ncbi:MAG: hypothetical protein V4469_05200 [Patescibacteria group bacterium]
MKNQTKMIVGSVLVLLLVIAVYTIFQNKSADVLTLEQNNDSDMGSQNTAPEMIGSSTTPAQQNPTVPPAVTTTSTAGSAAPATLTYKGQFFPFEFSYPADFRLPKNPAPSTKDQESKTYSFNSLAINGGIGGYVSFYVTKGNDDALKELATTYPDKYNKVTINGNIFYKYVDVVPSNGYKVEYTTFKNETKYRFSLIVVNGDKKQLDIGTYKPEFDMFDTIIKSLKIN